MKTITIQEIQSNFKDYLNQLHSELLVITENGRPVAAINLIVDEEELERLMLTGNSRFNQVLEAADRQIQETGGIRNDDFWKLLEQE
ncbi:MAG TPA: type II toxin-antitoxin system Phd/YefM family antitoxin [Cyanobacteria bacterium UBA8543]|nr:type II toxin-antitoxin system Phd/YefM family antitoxin [Cyanobacteria bacterium UBA8543]